MIAVEDTLYLYQVKVYDRYQNCSIEYECYDYQEAHIEYERAKWNYPDSYVLLEKEGMLV